MKNKLDILVYIILLSFLLTFDLYGQKDNGGTGIATSVGVMMATTDSKVVMLDGDTSSFAKVYPNPVENNMFVETSNINIKEIKLFNLNGQIQNHQISIRYGIDQIQINISQLQSGIYLLRLETEIGAVVKKIIVR